MNLDLLGILSVIIPGVLWFGGYTLLSLASHIVGVWLQSLLVHTHPERLLWHHHKKRVQRLDHATEHPRDCSDCAELGPN